HWPVGYSAVIAGLLKMGVNYQLALRFLKASLIVVSLFAWCWYERQNRTSVRSAVFFYVLLSPTVAYFSYSITDLVLVAGMPLLLQWTSNISTPDYRFKTIRAFSLGFFVSALIMKKYLAAIYLMISAAIILVPPRRYTKETLLTIATLFVL